MSNKNEIVADLKAAIIGGDEEGTKKTAERILAEEIDPMWLVRDELPKIMKEVGDKFETGELFLTDMMLAAEAAKSAVATLEPHILKGDAPTRKRGKIIIGTVKNDIHDIGKNLVGALLEANGFEVYDMGNDIDPMTFVEKVRDIKPDILALSCLMTNTMPYQAEVITFLKQQGLRDKVKIIVGGGPTTQDWSDEIGADGWASNAALAVPLVKKLLSK